MARPSRMIAREVEVVPQSIPSSGVPIRDVPGARSSPGAAGRLAAHAVPPSVDRSRGARPRTRGHVRDARVLLSGRCRARAGAEPARAPQGRERALRPRHPGGEPVGRLEPRGTGWRHATVCDGALVHRPASGTGTHLQRRSRRALFGAVARRSRGHGGDGESRARRGPCASAPARRDGPRIVRGGEGRPRRRPLGQRASRVPLQGDSRQRAAHGR